MNVQKMPTRDYSNTLIATGVSLYAKIILIFMAMVGIFVLAIAWRYVVFVLICAFLWWLIAVYPGRRQRAKARDQRHIEKYGRPPRPWGEHGVGHRRPW